MGIPYITKRKTERDKEHIITKDLEQMQKSKRQYQGKGEIAKQTIHPAEKK